MAGWGGYEEVLALECFKRALDNYTFPYIDEELFEPFVRNLSDESVLEDIRDTLMPPPDGGDTENDRCKYAEWRRSIGRCSPTEMCAELWGRKDTHRPFLATVSEMTERILVPMEAQTAEDPLRGRIDELRTTLHLGGDDVKVLLVLWLLGTGRLERFGRRNPYLGLAKYVSLCAGLDEQTVRVTLRTSSRLCRYGLVSSRDRSEVTSRVRDFFAGLSDESLASLFYRRDTEPALPTSFFGELTRKHIPVLKRLLAARKGKGVNILLYGPPGTGKTSFSRALAAETGRTCYRVEQRPKDRDGDFTAAKSEIRYAAIQICDEQTDPDSALVVVDEADALLRCGSFLSSDDGFSAGDKGLLNDVLDKNRSPTVWIANTEADELDLSNRRRFDYSVRFEPMSAEQRVGAWSNAAAKAGLSHLLPKKEIARLVGRYAVSTGIAAQAFENAARAGVTKSECAEFVVTLLERQCELSGASDAQRGNILPVADYSLEGLNVKSKVPLAKVVRAARRFMRENARGGDRDAPRMNILLSGVPGSGKTEFVKYLASRLGAPLRMLKPSDLKSKWVGETERNIAAAFRGASTDRAVLFFDEVDTFLDNREALAQGHDKAMVNELLQQMENFRGVFVGTTNFATMLDPAVARRFTFKIELDVLTEEGKRHFFAKFFDEPLTEEEGRMLDRIDGLTPGDFRTVRQELYYLGDETDNADRLAALEEEARAKSAGRHVSVGFN